MTSAEETALLLEALEQGFVKADAVIRWADQAIAAAPQPPEWLIDLSTLPKIHTEDVAASLREHAQTLPVRRKIELIALAWQRRLLSLRDALPRLFKVTILDRMEQLREGEEPLHDALVEWDSQEDLDVLSPELEAKFEMVLKQYLRSAADIAWCLPCGGQTKPEPGASPNGGPATRFGSSGVREGLPSVS
jgi:hypothetical protein